MTDKHYFLISRKWLVGVPMEPETHIMEAVDAACDKLKRYAGMPIEDMNFTFSEDSLEKVVEHFTQMKTANYWREKLGAYDICEVKPCYLE